MMKFKFRQRLDGPGTAFHTVPKLRHTAGSSTLSSEYIIKTHSSLSSIYTSAWNQDQDIIITWLIVPAAGAAPNWLGKAACRYGTPAGLSCSPPPPPPPPFFFFFLLLFFFLSLLFSAATMDHRRWITLSHACAMDLWRKAMAAASLLSVFQSRFV